MVELVHMPNSQKVQQRMHKDRFIYGFSKEEEVRVSSHMERLLPHLEKNRFVIVGGIAIRYHLINAGIEYPQREFNNLDIIVEEERVVKPTVTEDFLIAHHHPEDGYFALVDPVSRTKVDIFNYFPSPEAVQTVNTRIGQIKLVSIEDQLVKTVLDASRISFKAHVEPKQFTDMRLLAQIVNLEKVNRIWQKYWF